MLIYNIILADYYLIKMFFWLFLILTPTDWNWKSKVMLMAIGHT